MFNGIMNIDVNWIFAVPVFVCVTLDILSGLWASVVQGNFSSSKMREGLKHKITLMLWLVVAAACDICYLAVGFDTGLSVPIFEGVCVYMYAMELGSVVENLDKAYPDANLMQFFTKEDDE